MLLRYILRAVFVAIGSVVIPFGIPIASATDVSNDIVVDTTWTAANSPYVITRDIFQVAFGVSLTIEADVVVQFSQTTQFDVQGSLIIEEGVQFQLSNVSSMVINGTLDARGTSTKPIVFSPVDPLGAWMSIQFTDGSIDATFSGNTFTGGSIIQFVRLDSCGVDGINNSTITGGCIELIGAHPFIDSVTIQNGTSTGINGIDINGDLRIKNSTIQDIVDDDVDESGGIYIDALTGSNVEIIGNVIQNNSSDGIAGGVSVNDAAILKVQGNQILNNSLTVANDGAGGLAIDNFSVIPIAAHQIDNNTIADNTSAQDGGGIWVNDTNVVINNNFIMRNITTSGVGGGLYIGDNTSATIQNNIITGNESDASGAGVFVLNTVQNPLTVQQNVIADNLAVNSNVGGIDIQGGDITLTENIVADNVASGTNAAMRLSAAGTATGNAIIRNDGSSIIRISLPINAVGLTLDFSQNTMVDNLSTANLIGSTITSVTNLPTIASNNIWNNGAGFYISQQEPGPTLANATNNYYGTNDDATIQSNIAGLVTYSPFAMAPHTDVPMSPPGNFTAQRSGDSANLSWSMPMDGDLTGYRVYQRNSQTTQYTLALNGDVGLINGFVVTGLDPDLDYYFAVTAYDATYVSTNDVNTTITNDNQTNGSESWFSEEVFIARANSGSSGGGGSGGGGSTELLWVMSLLLAFGARRHRANARKQ